MAEVLKTAGYPDAYAFEVGFDQDSGIYTLQITYRSRTMNGDEYLTQTDSDTTLPDADALRSAITAAFVTRLHTEGYTIQHDVLT